MWDTKILDRKMPQSWLLHIRPPPCTYLARVRPYISILCILGIHTYNHPPSHTIQFIEFMSRHDRFLITTHNGKPNQYNPLTQSIKIARWQINPSLRSIIASIWGGIDKQPIQCLECLNIPKKGFKSLMKWIHLTSIKYFTSLIHIP